MTKQEADAIDLKFESYSCFKLVAIGIDNAKSCVRFKKASQAVDSLSLFEEGRVYGRFRLNKKEEVIYEKLRQQKLEI